MLDNPAGLKQGYLTSHSRAILDVLCCSFYRWDEFSTRLVPHYQLARHENAR